MAKVTGPLFSLSASGNLKKMLVYTSSKGVAIVKKLTPATDSRTEAQDIQRTLYQNFTGLWNNLSEVQKNNWNEQAKGRPLTGFNLFMQSFLNIGPKYLDWCRLGVGKIGVNTIGIQY